MLGMPEIILILVVALVVFGPRKLPELGKSLGQAMAQFRRASDDFKRSWEQEVEIEKTRTSTVAESNYNSTSPSTYSLPEESSQPENAAPTHEPAVAGSGTVAETPR